MEKHVKIINTPDYVRDTTTGAVVLTNKKTLDKYLKQKQKVIEEKEKIEILENQVKALTEDVAALTCAVRDLLKYKQENCENRIEE